MDENEPGLPEETEIEEIAREFGLPLAPGDAASFRGLVAPLLQAVEALDAADDGLPPVRYPRGPAVIPQEAENPLGAWYVKARVEGAAAGPLHGRSVALKDNIMLAGVPMMNGTRLLEGYVPPIDASVVERILDAGGTIAGKAVCEAFCLSGGSHTSDTGPVRNPHDPRRHAGGSSSGSAALVAAGEVELALGGDQGGSIRMPSSFCGTVGMKATHGLVPYTGILAIDPLVDHVGPITANVADNALLLEVIAGRDGYDSRQVAPRVERYRDALGGGVGGVRIGLLEEGFGQPGAEPDVDAAVRAAARRLESAGANVCSVSVPEHRMAGPRLIPVFQGAMMQLLHTDGMGVGREDLMVPSLAAKLRGWREDAAALPELVKVFLLGTEVLRRRAGWQAYAKAVNQMRLLRAAYDTALGQVDVLMLPTTPMKAPVLPAPDAPREVVVVHASLAAVNTQPFDYSHHPALSVPCAMSEGLPVGMMLVGRAWEETTLYRVADAFEASWSWRAIG